MGAGLHHMPVSLFLFAGAESPHFTLLINFHPALAAQSRAQEALLSTSHRQSVRRSCNWNTDYMNNEPQTTRMTRNRDQGPRDDNEQTILIRDTVFIFVQGLKWPLTQWCYHFRWARVHFGAFVSPNKPTCAKVDGVV